MLTVLYWNCCISGILFSHVFRLPRVGLEQPNDGRDDIESHFSIDRPHARPASRLHRSTTAFPPQAFRLRLFTVCRVCSCVPVCTHQFLCTAEYALSCFPEPYHVCSGADLTIPILQPSTSTESLLWSAPRSVSGSAAGGRRGMTGSFAALRVSLVSTATRRGA